MADYQAMYYRLFNAITDALEALNRAQPCQAAALLACAQEETEEIYLKTSSSFPANP